MNLVNEIGLQKLRVDRAATFHHESLQATITEIIEYR